MREQYWITLKNQHKLIQHNTFDALKQVNYKTYCVFGLFSASVPKYRKYAIFLVSRSEQSAAEHFGVHTGRESSESIDAGLEP